MDQSKINSVFITGAASGLGKAIALEYAKQGANICIADLHEERGAETVAEVEQAGGQAYFHKLDVRDYEAIVAAREAMIEKWGEINIVVNNAGVASAGVFDDIGLDTWEWMLSINLMGVVKGCKAFTPTFKKQGHGHFVNIASMAGLITPPGMADYNVAKAGVVALSDTLRSELAPYNINTTVVCPSFFQTNLGESLKTTHQNSSDNFNKLLATSEITANDIAAMIATAVAENTFLLLPHKKAQFAYDIKQKDPEAYHAEMVKIAESNRRKHENNN